MSVKYKGESGKYKSVCSGAKSGCSGCSSCKTKTKCANANKIAEFSTKGSAAMILSTYGDGSLVKIGDLKARPNTITLAEQWQLVFSTAGNFTIKVKIYQAPANVSFSLVQVKGEIATVLTNGSTGCNGCLSLGTTRNLPSDAAIGVIVNGQPCIDQLKMCGSILVNSWKPKSCNGCEPQTVAIVYNAGRSPSDSTGSRLTQEEMDVLNQSLNVGLFCGVSDIKYIPYYVPIQPLVDDPGFVTWVKLVSQQVENAFASAYNQGIQIAGLVGNSTFVGPWLTGDPELTNFNGLNVAQRSPINTMIVVLITLQAAAIARELALPNVFETNDVYKYDKLYIPSLIVTDPPTEGSIAAGVGIAGAGVFLPVVEQASAAAVDRMNEWIEAIQTYNLTHTPIPLTLPGVNLIFDSNTGTYTAASIQDLVDQVALLPSAPGDRSIVAISVFGAPENLQALVLAINANPTLASTITITETGVTTEGNVTYLGVNFGPVDTPLANIDLYLGMSASASPYLPPVLIKRLGLPVLPSDPNYNELLEIVPKLDAVGFLNSVILGCPFTGFDSLTRFDALGGPILPLVNSSIVPKQDPLLNIVQIATVENPRWTAAIPVPPPIFPSDICGCGGKECYRCNKSCGTGACQSK